MLKTTVIGHLGRDAEVKEINGKKVTAFSIASTENWKSKDGEKKSKTTWVRCLYFNENIAKYLTKGKLLYIEGSPYANGWTDKDGNVKADLNINVNKLEFLNGGKTETKANTTQESSTQEGDDFPF